jgi:hypothetical protein
MTPIPARLDGYERKHVEEQGKQIPIEGQANRIELFKITLPILSHNSYI